MKLCQSFKGVDTTIPLWHTFKYSSPDLSLWSTFSLSYYKIYSRLHGAKIIHDYQYQSGGCVLKSNFWLYGAEAEAAPLFMFSFRSVARSLFCLYRLLSSFPQRFLLLCSFSLLAETCRIVQHCGLQHIWDVLAATPQSPIVSASQKWNFIGVHINVSNYYY